MMRIRQQGLERKRWMDKSHWETLLSLPLPLLFLQIPMLLPDPPSPPRPHLLTPQPCACGGFQFILPAPSQHSSQNQKSKKHFCPRHQYCTKRVIKENTNTYKEFSICANVGDEYTAPSSPSTFLQALEPEPYSSECSMDTSSPLQTEFKTVHYKSPHYAFHSFQGLMGGCTLLRKQSPLGYSRLQNAIKVNSSSGNVKGTCILLEPLALSAAKGSITSSLATRLPPGAAGLS